MIHTVLELAALVRAALDCLEESGEHCAAMLHANVLGLDDPTARVRGYRDGGLTSLDPIASAARIAFRSTTPGLHAALVACLGAYASANRPLYLLRLRFSRGSSGWELTRTSLQSTDERVRLLVERRSLDERVKAALATAVDGQPANVAVSWNDLPGRGHPMLGVAVLADGSDAPFSPGADIIAARSALKDFYAERGFVLDAAHLELERVGDSDTLVCHDYYG